MAKIQLITDLDLMALPLSIARGNPIPVDSTMVWYDEAKMKEYAANGATAYVGQILSLVDEVGGAAKAFIIANAAGDLLEVGSATLGDEKTITLGDDGVLALKNWGVQYYKWVEGETEGEGEHVLVQVDENNPWIAGLEPKVSTATDGTLEIAWYQPSTLTVEGVSSIVNTMQQTVNNLVNVIGDAEDTAEEDTLYGEIAALKAKDEELESAHANYLPLAGGTMSGDIVLPDGGKAASEKVVDTKIAAAIGSAGHLKREIVAALPAVEDADADTIYMVKVEGKEEYQEYILVEGAFELIGNTAVDLTPYAQKVEGAVEGNLATLAADGSYADSALSAQEVADHLDNTEIHITADERTAWNAAAELAETNKQAIEALPEISAEDAEKLAALPAITEIGDNLTLENGVLAAVAEQYELPAATADTLGGIKIGNGLEIADGVASVKVNAANANGLSVDASGLAFGLATEDAAGAMSAEQYVKLANIAANAQVNTVNGMLIGEEAAEINEDKMLVLPFATAEKPGVVKSSEADNGILVAADGTMSVNRVSTSKLFVPEGEELVLNGGDAAI